MAVDTSVPTQDPSSPPSLMDVLRRDGRPAPEGHLRDDVRFHSPYADYHGRADVAHLIGLIAQVLTDVEATRRVIDGSCTLTVLHARVGRLPVQGVLCEEHDQGGRLADAMLLLRPYGGLRAAMDHMRALLADAPLPSAAA